MRSRLLLLGLLALTAGCDRRKNVGEGAYANRVASAIPKIEKATGLKFKAPPKLELRSRAQVREFLLRKFNEATPAEQLRGEEIAYKLFGLIPDTMDLRRFLLELLTEQIVGYYDPATKVLYVVEGAPSDLVGITITHELVHALQDQYVNLDSIQKLKGNSDRQAAAQAVLEGHATYEQMKIMLGGSNVAAQLSGGWDAIRQSIRESQSAMPIFASAPLAIQESLLFPYLSGAEFVRRFEHNKPQASPLDSIPTSTEQILSEAAYFGATRDEATDIRLPATPDTTHEDAMGEFGTRLFLFQHHRDQTGAIEAAHGWDGDRYRIVLSANGASLLWVTVWDSAVDAVQFAEAAGQAVGRRYRAGAPSVTRGGVRSYTGGAGAGSGRRVVITPREIGGRNVVIFADVPSGVSPAIVDPSRISIGPPR